MVFGGMGIRDEMAMRYALGDLRRNKGVNIALAVLILLSAFLMVTGGMVMERLVGSMNQLFEAGKPPHFLQMHTGDYSADSLDRFAGQHPEIADRVVVRMLDYDSAALTWSRPSAGISGDMSGSLVENLFVTQNPRFDFLLDENSQVAHPETGTVYVPVAYQQRFGLQAGDVLGIRTTSGVRSLQIAGFVRDPQMASSMSTATRFLVSDADFAALSEAGGGSPEIIAEYRLVDPGQAQAFQTAYAADPGLPKNGPAVTFVMIQMINAISDGIVAVVLVLASLLLIAIALLSLRFVIRGTLEDEVHQIGAMKAIGLPDATISGLFLVKYRLMTAVSCLLGGAAAVGATFLLTQTIQVNYARAPIGGMSLVVPVVALLVVYATVMGLCRGVLRGVGRAQVVNALVHGSMLGDTAMVRRSRKLARRAHRVSLDRLKGRGMNWWLVLLDLRTQAASWVLIPVVFFLATVQVTLPLNLLTTFESPQFITYLGAPEYDLRIDVKGENADAEREAMLAAMSEDSRLRDGIVYANVIRQVQGPDGWETMRLEAGDYSGSTVEFLEGTGPRSGEVALSVLNARKLGVRPGQPISMQADGQPVTLTVSGVYQDATSGGYTAKLGGKVTSGAVSYIFYADVGPGVDVDAVASDYAQRFPSSTVFPMARYASQTLSYVTGALRGAALVSCVMGIGVATLITVLFLRLRLTRDRRQHGVLSALGFSGRELAAQLLAKTLLCVVAGALAGVLFTVTAGERLAGAAISAAGMGITQLAFVPSPLVWVLCPLVLVACGGAVALLMSRVLLRADKSSWLARQ